MKFLRLLLLLQEQASRVLPRKPGDAGLETMPGEASGDTSHMLLRNLCTVVPKAQSFSGIEPQHWLSYQHRQTSCGRRAPPPHQPWPPSSLQFSRALVNSRGSCRPQGRESRVLRGRESLWKYGFNNFGPVSACIFQWQYMDLFKTVTVRFLLTSCTVRWCFEVTWCMTYSATD